MDVEDSVYGTYANSCMREMAVSRVCVLTETSLKVPVWVQKVWKFTLVKKKSDNKKSWGTKHLEILHW